MSNSESPILDFYPQEFEQDLNGKKQEWEAVVKIPFIDQERLLRAMACKSFPHALFTVHHSNCPYSTRAPFDKRGAATKQLRNKLPVQT